MKNWGYPVMGGTININFAHKRATVFFQPIPFTPKKGKLSPINPWRDNLAPQSLQLLPTTLYTQLHLSSAYLLVVYVCIILSILIHVNTSQYIILIFVNQYIPTINKTLTITFDLTRAPQSDYFTLPNTFTPETKKAH